MLQSLLQSWSQDPAEWIASVGITIVLYAGLVLAIPILIARLPTDHLVRPPRPERSVVRATRIVVGLVIAGVGVALLFLPGPGIVTILLGLSIMGGPLAERWVRTLARRPRVLAAVNEIRRKRGAPPLAPPDDRPHDSA
ncbi:MAG: PGPGW domain-containing protein [Minicystis sp.]